MTFLAITLLGSRSLEDKAVKCIEVTTYFIFDSKLHEISVNI
jgi:hypothetical protein